MRHLRATCLLDSTQVPPAHAGAHSAVRERCQCGDANARDSKLTT
jgi:hypothetical protein